MSGKERARVIENDEGKENVTSARLTIVTFWLIPWGTELNLQRTVPFPQMFHHPVAVGRLHPSGTQLAPRLWQLPRSTLQYFEIVAVPYCGQLPFSHGMRGRLSQSEMQFAGLGPN